MGQRYSQHLPKKGTPKCHNKVLEMSYYSVICLRLCWPKPVMLRHPSQEIMAHLLSGLQRVWQVFTGGKCARQADSEVFVSQNHFLFLMHFN